MTTLDTQEVTFNIPTTKFSSVVMTRIKANVATSALEPVEDSNNEGVLLSLEDRLKEYVLNSPNFDKKLEEIRESAQDFLPDNLKVADFVSISMAQTLIASEFIQSSPVFGEILYVAVWDSITCVEAPIVRKIDSTNNSEQPIFVPDTTVSTELEEAIMDTE